MNRCFRIHLVPLVVVMLTGPLWQTPAASPLEVGAFRARVYFQTNLGEGKFSTVSNAVILDLQNAIQRAHLSGREIGLVGIPMAHTETDKKEPGVQLMVGDVSFEEFISKHISGTRFQFSKATNALVVPESILDRYLKHLSQYQESEAMVNDALKLQRELDKLEWQSLLGRRFLHSSLSHLTRSEIEERWKRKWAGTKIGLMSILDAASIDSGRNLPNQLIGNGPSDFHHGDLVWGMRLGKMQDGQMKTWRHELLWRNAQWKIVLFVPGV